MEHCIIATDMNRKVGNDKLGIHGNTDEISYGGTLIRDLISTGKYIFANNKDCVQGGPFTRIDPGNNESKSLLDVFILSKGLEQYLEKMIIDDQYKYPIQHPIKEKGKIVLKKSDHLTIILFLKNIPTRSSGDSKTQKVVHWNYHKEGGWEVIQAIHRFSIWYLSS